MSTPQNSDFQPRDLEPEEHPLNILYEDEVLLVIDKPAGLVVHPAPGHAHGTLVHALLYYYPHFAEEGAPERCGLVHRLDKGTSGMMVIAKTKVAQAELKRQFQERSILKEYWALVFGQPKFESGTICAPLGRHPKHRKKFSVQKEGGREAETSYRILETLGPFSILSVTPKTGRTHQIRVHLSSERHPIVGDSTYGGKRPIRKEVSPEIREAVHSLDRPALHAARLGFKNPETKKDSIYQSDIPEDLKSLVTIIKGAYSSP